MRLLKPPRRLHSIREQFSLSRQKSGGTPDLSRKDNENA